jgi:hypothetical protein
MIEFEQKALALLESVDRSLAGLASRAQTLGELAERISRGNPDARPGPAGDWNDAMSDAHHHRDLRRGEPRRQDEAHRWPR